MISSRVKASMLAAAMVAGGVGAEMARPNVKIADLGEPVKLETIFPRQFGAWRVDDSLPVILPSPDVQAKLDKLYNQTLSRTYVDRDGSRVMLSVAYGGDQSDGTSAHRPEVCYPAQGFQIDGNRRSFITLADGAQIAVRELNSHLGSRREPITYWIVVGEQTVTSGLEQKWVQIRYGVRGLVPDGMLVRVSTIDNEPARAYDVHRRFVADLASALDGQARRRVFGAESGATAARGPGAAASRTSD
jgi:EpsI family protein